MIIIKLSFDFKVQKIEVYIEQLHTTKILRYEFLGKLFSIYMIYDMYMIKNVELVIFQGAK